MWSQAFVALMLDFGVGGSHLAVLMAPCLWYSGNHVGLSLEPQPPASKAVLNPLIACWPNIGDLQKPQMPVFVPLSGSSSRNLPSPTFLFRQAPDSREEGAQAGSSAGLGGESPLLGLEADQDTPGSCKAGE